MSYFDNLIKEIGWTVDSLASRGKAIGTELVSDASRDAVKFIGNLIENPGTTAIGAGASVWQYSPVSAIEWFIGSRKAKGTAAYLYNVPTELAGSAIKGAVLDPIGQEFLTKSDRETVAGGFEKFVKYTSPLTYAGEWTLSGKDPFTSEIRSAQEWALVDLLTAGAGFGIRKALKRRSGKIATLADEVASAADEGVTPVRMANEPDLARAKLAPLSERMGIPPTRNPFQVTDELVEAVWGRSQLSRKEYGSLVDSLKEQFGGKANAREAIDSVIMTNRSKETARARAKLAAEDIARFSEDVPTANAARAASSASFLEDMGYLERAYSKADDSYSFVPTSKGIQEGIETPFSISAKEVDKATRGIDMSPVTPDDMLAMAEASPLSTGKLLNRVEESPTKDGVVRKETTRELYDQVKDGIAKSEADGTPLPPKVVAQAESLASRLGKEFAEQGDTRIRAIVKAADEAASKGFRMIRVPPAAGKAFRSEINKAKAEVANGSPSRAPMSRVKAAFSVSYRSPEKSYLTPRQRDAIIGKYAPQMARAQSFDSIENVHSKFVKEFYDANVKALEDKLSATIGKYRKDIGRQASRVSTMDADIREAFRAMSKGEQPRSQLAADVVDAMEEIGYHVDMFKSTGELSHLEDAITAAKTLELAGKEKRVQTRASALREASQYVAMDEKLRPRNITGDDTVASVSDLPNRKKIMIGEKFGLDDPVDVVKGIYDNSFDSGLVRLMNDLTDGERRLKSRFEYRANLLADRLIKSKADTKAFSEYMLLKDMLPDFREAGNFNPLSTRKFNSMAELEAYFDKLSKEVRANKELVAIENEFREMAKETFDQVAEVARLYDNRIVKPRKNYYPKGKGEAWFEYDLTSAKGRSSAFVESRQGASGQYSPDFTRDVPAMMNAQGRYVTQVPNLEKFKAFDKIGWLRRLNPATRARVRSVVEEFSVPPKIASGPLSKMAGAMSAIILAGRPGTWLVQNTARLEALMGLPMRQFATLMWTWTKWGIDELRRSWSSMIELLGQEQLLLSEEKRMASKGIVANAINTAIEKGNAPISFFDARNKAAIWKATYDELYRKANGKKFDFKNGTYDKALVRQADDYAEQLVGSVIPQRIPPLLRDQAFRIALPLQRFVLKKMANVKRLWGKAVREKDFGQVANIIGALAASAVAPLLISSGWRELVGSVNESWDDNKTMLERMFGSEEPEADDYALTLGKSLASSMIPGVSSLVSIDYGKAWVPIVDFLMGTAKAVKEQQEFAQKAEDAATLANQRLYEKLASPATTAGNIIKGLNNEPLRLLIEHVQRNFQGIPAKEKYVPPEERKKPTSKESREKAELLMERMGVSKSDERRYKAERERRKRQESRQQ